jgi:hypothetical protein
LNILLKFKQLVNIEFRFQSPNLVSLSRAIFIKHNSEVSMAICGRITGRRQGSRWNIWKKDTQKKMFKHFMKLEIIDMNCQCL